MVKERTWYAYFTDQPTDVLKIEASSKSAAEKIARRYRKVWNINGELIGVFETEQTFKNLWDYRKGRM